MPSEIVIAVPVLGRPRNVGRLVASLDGARGDVGYRAVFLPCSDDRGELGALRASGADFLVTPFRLRDEGQWAKKINWLYERTTEPFLLLAADDLRFHPGWADRLMECATETKAGVVGTNDLGNQSVIRGDFSTHPLVRRSYVDAHGTIDEPYKILHEGYSHNWPDRELAETAKARGEWAFCKAAQVEHLHPHWRKGRDDATYEKGMRRFNEDRVLFTRRSRLWRSRRR